MSASPPPPAPPSQSAPSPPSASPAPPPPSAPSASSPSSASPPPPAPFLTLMSCWSCRVLSGSSLLLSAVFVYKAALKRMRLGGPVSMGTVAQITFAMGLGSWGVVVLTDPVGKAIVIDKKK